MARQGSETAELVARMRQYLPTPAAAAMLEETSFDDRTKPPQATQLKITEYSAS